MVAYSERMYWRRIGIGTSPGWPLRPLADDQVRGVGSAEKMSMREVCSRAQRLWSQRKRRSAEIKDAVDKWRGWSGGAGTMWAWNIVSKRCAQPTALRGSQVRLPNCLSAVIALIAAYEAEGNNIDEEV